LINLTFLRFWRRLLYGNRLCWWRNNRNLLNLGNILGFFGIQGLVNLIGLF
jgi:hypothetical protein